MATPSLRSLVYGFFGGNDDEYQRFVKQLSKEYL